MHMFHRQTNIVIGKMEINGLNCYITQAPNATFVKGQIQDLLIYEIGDYSHINSNLKTNKK